MPPGLRGFPKNHWKGSLHFASGYQHRLQIARSCQEEERILLIQGVDPGGAGLPIATGRVRVVVVIPARTPSAVSRVAHVVRRGFSTWPSQNKTTVWKLWRLAGQAEWPLSVLTSAGSVLALKSGWTFCGTAGNMEPIGSKF